MQINIPNFKNHQMLFWIGLLGLVFYAVSPVLFPKIPTLRQPELLPVYTLMMGLGQLMKGNTDPEGERKDEPKTAHPASKKG